MATEQNCCEETQCLLGGSSLKLAFRHVGTQRLASDVSTSVFCPIVPLKFRKDIFSYFHSAAHPRKLASRCVISSRFVWHGLSNDVTTWTHGYLGCQQGKIHLHTRLTPPSIPIP
jgi:hypothetical protein